MLPLQHTQILCPVIYVKCLAMFYWGGGQRGRGRGRERRTRKVQEREKEAVKGQVGGKTDRGRRKRR